jgi:hypothetical protein
MMGPVAHKLSRLSTPRRAVFISIGNATSKFRSWFYCTIVEEKHIPAIGGSCPILVLTTVLGRLRRADATDAKVDVKI